MIRKLAREAVIFMLVSAALTGVVALASNLYQRHKTITEGMQAVEKYKAQKAQAAKQNPTEDHPIWIYVDIAQEFNGYLSERPNPPPQIKKMHKDSVHCHPGSVTWSPENIEWVCVLPRQMPKEYRAGDVLQFDGNTPPGQYTAADIDRSDPNIPLFEIKPYRDLAFESLLLSGFGFFAGIGVWLFYRLVKFAVQG